MIEKQVNKFAKQKELNFKQKAGLSVFLMIAVCVIAYLIYLAGSGLAQGANMLFTLSKLRNSHKKIHCKIIDAEEKRVSGSNVRRSDYTYYLDIEYQFNKISYKHRRIPIIETGLSLSLVENWYNHRYLGSKNKKLDVDIYISPKNPKYFLFFDPNKLTIFDILFKYTGAGIILVIIFVIFLVFGLKLLRKFYSNF